VFFFLQRHVEYKSVKLKFVTWHVKRERAITYRTLVSRANMLKHVENEFLINVAIFAQISDVRYSTTR